MARAEPTVVIIGGGLAGLSTAVHALDHGLRPLILEDKSFLGGRTSSWDENGMHVEASSTHNHAH